MLGKINKNVLILLIIVLLGGVIRFINLGGLPAGFHGDEAAYGYNAYSILKTGTDEYGKRFPLILKSFEDYKPALYAYLDIPFIAIFGLNETATRLPSALFGTLTILYIYIFMKRYFKSNEFIALTSSFLLAITPWHIILSRTTSEVIVSLFFLLLMMDSLVRISEKYNWKWFAAAVISGILAFSSYTASRFYVLIIAVIFVLFSIQKLKKKIIVSNPLIGFLIIILILELIYNVFSYNNRFNQVSIFSNPATTLKIEEQIREDQFTPVIITRLFHNKVINYAKTISANYLQYFSLDFLALNGVLPMRQKVVDTGLYYFWELIFLLIGIIFIIKKQKRNELLLLAAWLLLLIPCAITRDDVPNVYRALVTIPFMIGITSVGLYEVWIWLIKLRKQLAIICGVLIISIFCVYEAGYFFHQYIIHNEKHQPWYRDFAMKGLVNAVNRYSSDFSSVIVTKTKASYIHFLFYDKTDPLFYQSSGSNMDKPDTGWGKLKFVLRECPLVMNIKKDIVNGDPYVLFVDAGTCEIPPRNAQILETVRWQDNSPAFRLLRYIPDK